MRNKLHDYWPVIDGHADTLVRSVLEKRNFFIRSDHGHLDLPRIADAGVDLQILAICSEKRNNPYSFAINILERWESDYAFFLENSDLNSRRERFIWIRNEADFVDWEKNRKIGVILALEGAEPLEGKVNRLEEFYRRGVRVLSLTWNWSNHFASGVNCRTDTGLTTLGKQVVQIGESMGYLLDLSHLGYKSFFDLLNVAKNPVIVSHANIFDLCPHQRNLRKEQIEAIADRGGCIGLTFYPPFLTPTHNQSRVGVEDLINHFEYLLEGWGDSLPAMGGDFDGIESTPYNLHNILDLGNLVGQMEKSITKKESIERILGGNLYRILKNIF